VYVRGPPLDRVRQDEIDELDHGGIVQAPFELGGVDLLLPDDLQFVVQLRDDVLELERLVEKLVDRSGDILLGGHHEFHGVAGLEPDGVKDRHVGGIRDRNDQLRPHPVDRKRHVLLYHVLGKEADHFRVDLVLGQVDHRDIELPPEEGQQF
jgi:hypothetical protein